jgi:Domain of unknown function (DUF4440)
MSPEALISQILDLETQRCDATIRRDLVALAALLDDRLIYTHSSGRLETKEGFLESIRTGKPRYDKIERDDVTVRVYHGLVAVVTGKAQITSTAGDQTSINNIRFTNVWTSSDGSDARWVFSTWQATRL